MAAEDELPEKLVKLEIGPLLPQLIISSSDLPVQLNPFYDYGLQRNELRDELPLFSTKTKQSHFICNNRIANRRCRRCRHNPRFVTALDELNTTSNAISDCGEYSRTPPSGVLKHTLKKTTSSGGASGNRKVLLREPVLKALQTCLHPHGNAQRKLFTANGGEKATPSDDGKMSTTGMSDFRDLIDECRNLLSENVDFTDKLNQISLSNRNSKNFTTMQASHKSSHNRKSIATTDTLSLPSPENTQLNENNAQASSISSTNTQQRNISNLSPEQQASSQAARCSTTCSQQAGNSSANPASDDVTIDELASYFDTFVHIPKKMSSMAEMMYI